MTDRPRPRAHAGARPARQRREPVRARIARQLRIGRALREHERTPRLAKVLLGSALAYAALPFDLIPDWIPILGQLDDVIIVGLLVWIAWRSVPEDVLAECRARAGIEAGPSASAGT